ncbi:MAG: iron-sulfur cluster repair di-iron protein [Candidatus Eiseniibacteriota bacterium]|jgi:regulator of cell morphogenesis and NO signaling
MTISHDTRVGDLVSERVGRSEVFERLGIDYCCGGARTLGEAARQVGLEPDEVAEALAASDRAAVAGAPQDSTDWRSATLTALTNHIVETHHAYMKRQLPRVGELMDKVLAAHRERHPELADVANVLAGLRTEIDMHLAKEEQVLFPLIQEMEATGEAGHGHCGSVRNPIAVMEHEHDHAGSALARLRQLTDGYTPPADACATYRALLDALAEMEGDLHRHIHKENNILHPRATQLEASLLAVSTGDAPAAHER